jgi:hypothetical protein
MAMWTVENMQGGQAVTGEALRPSGFNFTDTTLCRFFQTNRTHLIFRRFGNRVKRCIG